VYAQGSNTGTKQTSRWRERFGFVDNQLTGNDDILQMDYSTAGFETSHAFTGSYEGEVLDLERLRWRVSGSYSQYLASDIGFADSSFTGNTATVGGELIWNFYQRGDLFVDAVVGLRAGAAGERGEQPVCLGDVQRERGVAGRDGCGIGFEPGASGCGRELGDVQLGPDVFDVFGAAVYGWLEPGEDAGA
jgi:hypothetical protein